MGNNYLLEAEFDNTAPRNKEESRLSCPICKMDSINIFDNICVCNDCGYENYIDTFLESGSNEASWERLTYDGE